MEDNFNNNEGVCCDVCDCVYNQDGCNCKMKTIKVTKGNNNNAHFCKSFESKTNN